MKQRVFWVVSLVGIVGCSGTDGARVAPPTPEDPSIPDNSSPEGDPGPTPENAVTLTVAVDGNGIIRSSPPSIGIACPGQCTAKVAKGTKVALTLSPAEGWAQKEWSGSCAGGEGPSCKITVDTDVTAGASLSLIDARWDPSVGAADCAAAWGTAGEKLSSCDKTRDNYVVVHKSKRNTALCKSGKLVKNYRVGLGFTPSGAKQKEGDGKTPEGVFYIPRVIPDSGYHRALLLSYPTKDDATRGFAAGLISSYEKSDIAAAIDGCKEPPSDTSLGGLVEINGGGSKDDWTAGSIALEDADVDAVWSALSTNDTIVVLP